MKLRDLMESELVEVLMFYDEPILTLHFVKNEAFYLCMAESGGEEYSQWLWFSIDKKNLLSAINGRLDLRSAIQLSDNLFWETRPTESDVEATLESKKFEDLGEEDLPLPDCPLFLMPDKQELLKKVESYGRP